MNAKGALKEAIRRWGKTAAVEDRKRFSSTPENRLAARQQLVELREKLTPEERKARREEMDSLFSAAESYRFTVGYISGGIAFHVSGRGDTWERAFQQADYIEAQHRAA